MKRRNRDINIFSISALDLFASAMGVFILLTVVLFPYYLKNSEIMAIMSAMRQELEQTQAQLAQSQQQLSECTAQLQQCEAQRAELQENITTLAAENRQLEQRLQECQAQNSHLQGQIDSLEQQVKSCHEKLKQTFLAVVIKWATDKQDVDLHIIDVAGNEFYYSRHNRDRSHFSNSNAELSVDTTNGPGIEIWEEPRAQPGRYKIYLNLYSRNDNSQNPLVKTTIYYRDGGKKLPDITLTQERRKQLVATVEVNADGSVEVR